VPVRKLRRLQFGRESERLPDEQLQLSLEDLEAAIAKADAEAERGDPALRRDRAAKRRANRGRLPPYLPRLEVELTLRCLRIGRQMRFRPEDIAAYKKGARL
jgi:hypothetical protein